MTSTSITIRIDKDLKNQAEEIFKAMGLNLTTALTIFTKTVVREQRIPFEISIDPFYSQANKSRLLAAIKEMDEGKGKLHDTIKCEDE